MLMHLPVQAVVRQFDQVFLCLHLIFQPNVAPTCLFVKLLWSGRVHFHFH